MSKKPVASSPQEGSSPSEPRRSCWVRCMRPFTFFLILSILMASLLLYYCPWQSQAPHSDDIATLKNLTMALNDRINHLESSEKAISTPSTNPELIHEIEGRIATLQQQIETLKNQPKTEEPAGQLEKVQAFEKDLMHLAETQKTIKTTLIFWRLKKKVLSDAPYAMELAAYKAATQQDQNLALLEKYADQGLGVLKSLPEEPGPASSDQETASWWSRLKRAARSLIKIEKVGPSMAQPSSFSPDRQAIEDLLTRLDQALTQQLDMPLPLSGDAL